MQVDRKLILYMLADSDVFDLKRDTTQDRLRLQKTIYLLQAFGLRIGYGFSWYRYGPYSQELVYDAYKVLSPDSPERAKYARETSTLSFSASIQEKFKRFKEICRNILNDPTQLELAASVDFVRTTWIPNVKKKSEFPILFRKYKTRLFGSTEIIPDESIGQAFDICERLRQNNS